MPQFAFGSGSAWGLIKVGALYVPRKFGILQDISIDFNATTKELFGQYSFPVAVARGQTKIDGKAKFGQFSGAVFNDLFFAGTNAVGQTITVSAEVGSIPATPFTVTVVNAATWVDDLGVTYTSGAKIGQRLQRVASAPTTGQYTAAAGAYVFAAADTLLTVAIDYTYTVVTGNTTTIINQLMGVAPIFQVVFGTVYNSQPAEIKLNACVSKKLTLATKIDDFTVPEFDFSAFADAANNVGTISMVEL